MTELADRIIGHYEKHARNWDADRRNRRSHSLDSSIEGLIEPKARSESLQLCNTGRLRARLLVVALEHCGGDLGAARPLALAPPGVGLVLI